MPNVLSHPAHHPPPSDMDLILEPLMIRTANLTSTLSNPQGSISLERIALSSDGVFGRELNLLGLRMMGGDVSRLVEILTD